MEKIPSPLPFALWNRTREVLKRGEHTLCLLSLAALDRFATEGPSPIGGIAFTGDPERFTKLYRLIAAGVPLEPIHIVYIPARLADATEQQALGLSEIPETIGFVEGRHRYALLRHNRWQSIFACVPNEDLPWFNARLHTSDPDCILVSNPAGD